MPEAANGGGALQVAFRRFGFAAALAMGAVASCLELSASTASAQEWTGQTTYPAVDPNEAPFQAYLQTFRGRALAQGVSQKTLDSVLPTLAYNPRVVELDQAQPGGQLTGTPSATPAFSPYRAKHVSADLIARGRAAYAAQRYNLQRVEAETGVPESVMVAIWGQETNYGAYTGDFDLARSLATLAYEGRRRPLFESELVATLKLIDRGIPREQLKGSWAGATGYPQFLPSVYLRI